MPGRSLWHIHWSHFSKGQEVTLLLIDKYPMQKNMLHGVCLSPAAHKLFQKGE